MSKRLSQLENQTKRSRQQKYTLENLFVKRSRRKNEATFEITEAMTKKKNTFPKLENLSVEKKYYIKSQTKMQNMKRRKSRVGKQNERKKREMLVMSESNAY